MKSLKANIAVLGSTLVVLVAGPGSLGAPSAQATDSATGAKPATTIIERERDSRC